MTQALDVSGTYFESCNCFAPCSCVCLSPPTEGECVALIAWHVDKGGLGDVVLDGLNAALFAHAPGHMMQTKWRVALYLDERANAAQQEALGKVFSGQAGGPLAALAPLIGEVMGVRTAAIDYQSDGKRRSLRTVPGSPAVVAKSKYLRYSDHGYQREMSDRNGFYSPFSYKE